MCHDFQGAMTGGGICPSFQKSRAEQPLHPQFLQLAVADVAIAAGFGAGRWRQAILKVGVVDISQRGIHEMATPGIALAIDRNRPMASDAGTALAGIAAVVELEIGIDCHQPLHLLRCVLALYVFFRIDPEIGGRRQCGPQLLDLVEMRPYPHHTNAIADAERLKPFDPRQKARERNLAGVPCCPDAGFCPIAILQPAERGRDVALNSDPSNMGRLRKLDDRLLIMAADQSLPQGVNSTDVGPSRAMTQSTKRSSAARSLESTARLSLCLAKGQ